MISLTSLFLFPLHGVALDKKELVLQWGVWSLLSPEVWRYQQVLKGHLPLGLLSRSLTIYKTTLFPLLLTSWPGIGEGKTQTQVTYVHRDLVANVKRSPTQKLYSHKQTELSEIPACSELTRPDSQCALPQHGRGCSAGHSPGETASPPALHWATLRAAQARLGRKGRSLKACCQSFTSNSKPQITVSTGAFVLQTQMGFKFLAPWF